MGWEKVIKSEKNPHKVAKIRYSSGHVRLRKT